MPLLSPAQSQVLRFEPAGPAEIILDGREFGAAGRYERITARATIALDPANPRNGVIADLALAPRNAQGQVEAVADVTILRPADPARGNGTMLLEVPNRGRKLALPLFNGSPTAASEREAGNGFLFRQGYTLVWVGWQGDFRPAPGQLGITLPVLQGVSGSMREELQVDANRPSTVAALHYPAANPSDARLTVRHRWDGPRETPPDLSFRFTAQDRVEVMRPAGFDAGAIYELTYTARDPQVLGLGFAAIRDVASFLRHETGGTNPLAGQVWRSIGFGVSQSGRFLRDFLYLGFNEDTQGRAVFDGLMPHVAGGRRLFMNTRFARPDKAPRHLQDPAWPADAFPFTYSEVLNPFTGERDSLMRRCRLSSTCPRVMHTDTEYEWWGARASLVVTDLGGRHLDLPGDVRTYMVTGAPHFAEPGAATRTLASCALPVSPVHAGAPMRALLGHLEAWVRGESEPPANRAPSLAAGTLVDPAQALPVALRSIPYSGIHVPAAQSDHSVVPPRELGRFPVYVPRLDLDGMAIAGIRLPAVEAPRASLLAWNPRASGYGEGMLCPLQGSVVPFAASASAREAAGDLRPSLEERYETPAAYVAAVRQAAERLVGERLLLPEDAAAMVTAAENGALSP
ncbi:alpha/beta hydrolase domain-containing protein [Sabulicella rubraurantiaca]|uniref:alpha/beta hydrolase domain-containing protein n=1 Tax=Sabulicella rubraurantiaca TaxID=2811429 RepID=UPI001A97181A|nr:alpha/beta hydrolase domain-containing protein [Sabulicella rubraurantiaca]